MVKYVGIILVLCTFELIHVTQNQCIQGQSVRLDNVCDMHQCYPSYGVNVSCDNIEGLNINLEDFPSESNERFTLTLIISHSDIETLPLAAFSDVRNISVLSMEDVNLTNIQPGAFSAHPHLKEIYFARNNLVSIPYGVFNTLQKLTALDLSRNRIENISQHAFLHSNLAMLNLSRNAISTLGSSLVHLRNLKVLDLSFNNLIIIQNCIEDGTMDKPKVNQTRIISCIPLSLYSTLERIYLGDNKIRSINPLGRNIVIFDAGNNLLSNLSIELFKQSTGLRTLLLDGNGISAIPNSLFGALRHLSTLDLSNNSLSSFSYGTFDGLTEIETIDVSGNRLKSLPGAFHSLGSLSNLYLQNNELHDLNLDELFEGMPNVKTINLNGNKWNCRTLRNITIQLRRRMVNIISGFQSEGTNVFGTACYDEPNENWDKLDRITNGKKLEVNLDNSNLQNFFNTDFKKSALYRFFVDDFKNTSFASRLKGDVDRKQSFEQNVETAFDRLERNFENSSRLFLEIAQNIAKAIDKGDESFRENTKSRSTELENLTYSIKNLENYLEKFSQIIETHTDVQSSVVSDVVTKNFSETMAEKFAAEHLPARDENPDHTLFVFFLILMVANVLLISVIVYIVVFRLKLGGSRSDIQMSPIVEDRS